MSQMRPTRSARIAAALGAAVLVLSLGATSVLAGEVTGNGKLKEVHGRSACAFSGQEDLQFFYDDEDTLPKEVATKGDPGHAQSWGQIPKAIRDELTAIGLNPGNACNPTRSTSED
jgi:hypothetical protein